MKLKDIKEGKEYANNYGQKITVLEVGLFGRVYHDRVGSFRSHSKHFVKVERIYGSKSNPFEEIIHFSTIAHPWKTQEKIDKLAAETISKGEDEVAYLWSILEQNTSLTRRSHWPSTRIELKHNEVVEVCKALEEHGQPKVQSPD